MSNMLSRTLHHGMPHTCEPTISSLELACLPKSGPAVTGPGDLAAVSSPAGMRTPLCANAGYADLFCLGIVAASVTFVLTRRCSGRPLTWNPADGGVVLKLPEPEFIAFSCVRFAVIRASSELEDTSLGSLFVLDDRARPSGLLGGGVPSAPGAAPLAGSSVWMKQHRFPYGQDPDTQNV